MGFKSLPPKPMLSWASVFSAKRGDRTHQEGLCKVSPFVSEIASSCRHPAPRTGASRCPRFWSWKSEIRLLGGWFLPGPLLGPSTASSPCVFARSSLCARLCPHPFLQGHQSHWVRAHPDASFNFPASLKASSNYGHTLRSWGLGLPHECGGT